MMPKMTPELAPAGTRVLSKPYDFSSDFEMSELLVVEWSPAGRVKVRWPSGEEVWRNSPPYIIEVLPAGGS